ncbi:MAG: virulence RhuM family protein [Firmicutes bacterium]|nr:virulence RhuM family protein [Bacillota bacterium]
MDNKSEIIIYQTEDGQTKIDVRIEENTVWVTQNQIAELFQTTKQNISLHINNIFKEGELSKSSTVKEYLTVQNEGKRKVSRNIEYYNLDVIISVGYRVKSNLGTQFRIWATKRLNEYIIKGFTMNDDLLKKAGGGSYFDELLDRIRDIRSSEKVFWRKVLDIYATSVDYNPSIDTSKRFFQTIQNKIHWAAHKHTAAEVIMLRADAEMPFMGLTNFSGVKPQKADIAIAKNYLSEEEIDGLNLIVSAFLDLAEMQARRRIPMHMKEWIETLDGFLKLARHEILEHNGKVSSEDATKKALEEYGKYKKMSDDEITEVERHFIEAIEAAKKRVE